MLFPLTGNGALRTFPSRFFPEVAGSSLVHMACEELEMERNGLSPGREYGSSAHHRSEEWEQDPVGRSYGDDEEEEETFDSEEDDEFEDEEEDEDLDEDDDDYEEEDDEEEEDDDL
jgi:hypothetical protein